VTTRGNLNQKKKGKRKDRTRWEKKGGQKKQTRGKRKTEKVKGANLRFCQLKRVGGRRWTKRAKVKMGRKSLSARKSSIGLLRKVSPGFGVGLRRRKKEVGKERQGSTKWERKLNNWERNRN